MTDNKVYFCRLKNMVAKGSISQQGAMKQDQRSSAMTGESIKKLCTQILKLAHQIVIMSNIYELP